MSEIDWFPFYHKAFLADTMELKSEAKGLYLMLLINYYQRGHGCGTSVTTLATVAGVSEETWREYGPSILPLFEQRDGRLWHARCEDEISKAKRLMDQRKQAGQASAAKTRKPRATPQPLPREDHERHNDRGNGEVTDDTNTYTYSIREEEGPLRGPKKNAADAAPPPEPAFRILDHPLPSDFALGPEDVARCLNEAPADWLWSVFQQWKDYHLESGTLTTDWKAAWWRRWERSKPPEPVEPPKPKARVVVTTTPKAAKTKLPADWQPNANNAAVCAEEGYDLDAMAEHFRDVCGANGYRYINHHQAFSNFIRNQKNFTRGNSYVRPKGSIIESAKRAGANLDAKIREAEADEARARDGDQSVQGLSED